MKISGPGQIQSKAIKKTPSKQRTSGASFSSSVAGSESTTSTASMGGASPIASVDSLLALQEVPDSTDGRSKGLMRAEDMIDILEEIRKGILLGVVPMPNLRRLADMARNNQGKTNDAQLDEILNDIELRAEVELAKLGV